MQGVDENGEANLAILSRAVKRLQARGIRVVLSESSLNPRAALMCGPRYDMYSARMTRFANAHNVPYWNTNRDAKLTEADFHDWVHVSDPAAQRRHQQALVTGLRPILIELNEGPDV